MRNRFIRLEKISWKLTLLYSLLFSGVLLLLSAGVLYGVRYFLFEQSYENVRSSAAETITAMKDADVKDKGLADNDWLSDAQSDSDINIVIADPSGKIVNQSDNYEIKNNNVLYRPGVIRRMTNNGLRLMILNSEVKSGNKTIAYLQVAYNLEKNYKFIELLFMILAASDALGIATSVLAGYLVSRRMLRPIDRMTKTAQTISIRDLGVRIPTGRADDEITRLAVTFNDMLDRLKDSIDRQSRFVSDASHELRTPVSVILGYINLLDRWGKDDKKVLQESVDAIKNEAMGMRELMEKLLYLARNDSGMMLVNKENFNLSELFQEIDEESRMIAPQITVSIEADAGLAINADRKMLKQLLRNLIDNSIKFMKPKGNIVIHAVKCEGGINITVEDDGIGIPPDEVAHVFNRFYRVDKARSKETGGSGLGLAIVKSIVDVHSGTVNMESSPGRGTCVSIFLPQG